VRQWQQQCNQGDPDEGTGARVSQPAMEQLQERLASIPQRLEKLRKSGVGRLPRTDPEARWLRSREGFVVGTRRRWESTTST
jgi:hypothetical protein